LTVSRVVLGPRRVDVARPPLVPVARVRRLGGTQRVAAGKVVGLAALEGSSGPSTSLGGELGAHPDTVPPQPDLREQRGSTDATRLSRMAQLPALFCRQRVGT
jgi:hypothetical protein